MRQEYATARHLHRAERHPVRPDRDQHCGQVPGQVGPQHAHTSGHQSWQAPATFSYISRPGASLYVTGFKVFDNNF